MATTCVAVFSDIAGSALGRTRVGGSDGLAICKQTQMGAAKQKKCTGPLFCIQKSILFDSTF